MSYAKFSFLQVWFDYVISSVLVSIGVLSNICTYKYVMATREKRAIITLNYDRLTISASERKSEETKTVDDDRHIHNQVG